MNNRLLLLFGGLALGLACAAAWNAPRRPAPYPRIRAAGRREMEDPPRHWDQVDEQGDESFPASDPPGNY
ncbi:MULTISPECIES: hypothetical protein [Paracoccus]|uniref:hypothetical protein n=1 Tax=Paracoccus TaxID=265 RepID=UPI0007835AD3|nr:MULTISPECIES: hypothetical protein [Paracoccus]MCV2449213.1 hypothetical protein [Paracoccus sp. DMF]